MAECSLGFTAVVSPISRDLFATLSLGFSFEISPIAANMTLEGYKFTPRDNSRYQRLQYREFSATTQGTDIVDILYVIELQFLLNL